MSWLWASFLHIARRLACGQLLPGFAAPFEEWTLNWFDLFDLWHLLYLLFLVPIAKMIIYSFLSLFGVYVHLFWTLVMYNRFYRAFEGHSEQAVQYSMNNVFPKFYGSVGLDVALPNCLYCYCVVSWKYGKMNCLIWFDTASPLHWKWDIKYHTVPWAREWVRERASERTNAVAREQSELCGASEWVSGVSERASGRASGSVLTSRFLADLNHSALFPS